MGSAGRTSFETTFAVPLTCEDCIKDVSRPLFELDGIEKVNASLKDQLLFIKGTTAPSSIVEAIQSTGRDAILRGSGRSNSAAVCILETHSTEVPDKVRGLARLVQVSPTLTLVDLTIRGLAPGTYHATVRETGDVSEGAASTGGLWEALKSKIGGHHETQQQPRGHFGVVRVGPDGRGSAFTDQPVAIWELIGRSLVVSKQKDGPFQREDGDTLVGVIARSAGVWDNDKTVCSCSGKSVWEERKEQKSNGML